jgi:diaminohydroxyphosphoribosylaminopyrimidine deaminase/5-amino-6-(5-phosphoribosylamino)uracil reductase
MIKPLHVTLVSLLTIDGRITRVPGAASRDIIEQLGPEGKIDLHRYRAEAGAIAVGGRTVLIDNPSLTTRYVDGQSPLRVIFGGSCGFQGTEAVLCDGERTVLVADPGATLPQLGQSVEVIRAKQDTAALLEVCRVVSSRFSVSTLMLEGGATLTRSFFAARLIDEIVVYVVPCLAARSDAPSLTAHPVPDCRMGLVSCEAVGQCVKSVYRVSWNRS